MDLNFLYTCELNDDIVARYIDTNAHKISMNENIDINFIRKWKSKLDWKILSANYSFNSTELDEFFNLIDWRVGIYMQPECTEAFIEDNDLENLVSEMQNINDVYISRKNDEYICIDNVSLISESNRNKILGVLEIRVNSAIQNSVCMLDVMFEDGSVYYISTEYLTKLIRDIKIALLDERDTDIISAVRNSVEFFSSIEN